MSADGLLSHGPRRPTPPSRPVPISDWLSSTDARGYASWLVAFRAFPPILLAFVLIAGVLFFAAYRCATCCCCHRVRARSSKGASLLSWLLVLLAGAALAAAAYAAMGVLVTVGQLGGVAANTLNNASSFVCAANGSSCANDSLVGFADGLAARTAAAAADAGSFVANLSAPLDLLKATAAPAASLATLATGLNASIVSLSVELDELATSLDAARYHAKDYTAANPAWALLDVPVPKLPLRRSRTPRRPPRPRARIVAARRRVAADVAIGSELADVIPAVASMTPPYRSGGSDERRCSRHYRGSPDARGAFGDAWRAVGLPAAAARDATCAAD